MADLEKLFFIDIETTGLNADVGHRPWEVAIIGVSGKTLLHSMWRPSGEVMSKAEPMALKISGYYDRINSPESTGLRKENESYVANRVADILAGGTLCGAAVHFDARMLDVWLRENGQAPAWSHRLLDIESYVAGCTGYPLPASLGDTAKRVGVEYESDKKHTALYDAELARLCWVAINGEDAATVRKEASSPVMPTPPPMFGSEPKK